MVGYLFSYTDLNQGDVTQLRHARDGDAVLCYLFVQSNPPLAGRRGTVGYRGRCNILRSRQPSMFFCWSAELGCVAYTDMSCPVPVQASPGLRPAGNVYPPDSVSAVLVGGLSHLRDNTTLPKSAICNRGKFGGSAPTYPQLPAVLGAGVSNNRHRYGASATQLPKGHLQNRRYHVPSSAPRSMWPMLTTSRP